MYSYLAPGMPTLTHAAYLVGNVVIASLLLFKAVHQAYKFDDYLLIHAYEPYLTANVFFFFIAPVVFIFLTVWSYQSVPKGFSPEPDSSVPEDVIEKLQLLTSRFLVRRNQLVYRSRAGKFLALISVACLYIVGTLGGYINAALQAEPLSEWKLFEIVLTYHTNIGVLLFTVFSIIFGIDIELFFLGGRHVHEREMDTVEERLFQPLRDIILQYRVQVELVKGSCAHFAATPQTEDGVCIGGVTVAKYIAARHQCFALRSVALGRWIPVDTKDPTAVHCGFVSGQDLIF